MISKTLIKTITKVSIIGYVLFGLMVPLCSMESVRSFTLSSVKEHPDKLVKIGAPLVGICCPGKISSLLLRALPDAKITNVIKEGGYYIITPCIFAGSVYCFVRYGLGIANVEDLKNERKRVSTFIQSHIKAVSDKINQDYRTMQSSINDVQDLLELCIQELQSNNEYLDKAVSHEAKELKYLLEQAGKQKQSILFLDNRLQEIKLVYEEKEKRSDQLLQRAHNATNGVEQRLNSTKETLVETQKTLGLLVPAAQQLLVSTNACSSAISDCKALADDVDVELDIQKKLLQRIPATQQAPINAAAMLASAAKRPRGFNF